jgi:Macrocin-O-methyltransferase (TylF)
LPTPPPESETPLTPSAVSPAAGTLFHEPKLQSAADMRQFALMEEVFLGSGESLKDKIDAFPKFASRQAISKFLVRYEIFRQILEVNGSIVECGVLHGAGLFTFAKLSSIFEPVNHTRKIIGFDTFEGFPGVSDEDRGTGSSSHLSAGGLAGSNLADLERAVTLFDANRNLAHIPKVELVKGDLTVTGPEYVRKNPHLVVSLLYLDMDIYQPTKVALQTFLPRMPKGAIVAFDELNTSTFPGETIALQETIGIANLQLKRHPIDPYISYAIL